MVTIQGCSQKKPCIEPKYPRLEAVNKIPRINITVKDGVIAQNHTKKTLNTLKALRVSENYYWTLIGNYRKEFIK